MLTIEFDDRITGEIATRRPVLVIGRFDGMIRAPSVVIEGRAHVRGTVVAELVRIDGAFSGDVFARRLCLGQTCTVDGRIVHSELDVQQNAQFEGQSRRYPDPISLFRTLGTKVREARL